MEIPKQILKAAAYFIDRFGENLEYLGEQSGAQLWRFRFPDGMVLGMPVVYKFKNGEVSQLEGDEAAGLLASLFCKN